MQTAGLDDQELVDLLHEIDDLDEDVTDWEAEFMDSLFKKEQRYPQIYLSDKQRKAVKRMVERYLND